MEYDRMCIYLGVVYDVLLKSANHRQLTYPRVLSPTAECCCRASEQEVRGILRPNPVACPSVEVHCMLLSPQQQLCGAGCGGIHITFNIPPHGTVSRSIEHNSTVVSILS